MTAADWTPIVNAIIAGIGLVLTYLFATYVPRFITATETRTGIQLTDQQRSAVQGAAWTVKGILETKLDQGVLHVADITVENPKVLEQAQAAIARVSDSARAQGTTAEALAAIAVGLTDTRRAVAAPPTFAAVPATPPLSTGDPAHA
jgi:hypothetical protein